MALIKMKPTSPGTRTVIKIDRSHLHKGDPYAPANGPKRIAGSILAVMTPPTAKPAVLIPDKRATSDVTATNPTQSPRDDTVIAANRRENPGCVRRSLRVADLVPRSAATSSAMLDTSR